jgi:hypothetical protein
MCVSSYSAPLVMWIVHNIPDVICCLCLHDEVWVLSKLYHVGLYKAVQYSLSYMGSDLSATIVDVITLDDLGLVARPLGLQSFLGKLIGLTSAAICCNNNGTTCFCLCLALMHIAVDMVFGQPCNEADGVVCEGL